MLHRACAGDRMVLISASSGAGVSHAPAPCAVARVHCAMRGISACGLDCLARIRLTAMIALLAAGCAGGPPASPGGLITAAPASSQRAASAWPPEVIRQRFLQAIQQAQQSQAPLQLAQDPTALRGYVLYDYLLAARLQRALQLAATPTLDARIDAYLKMHAGEPVARELQHEWLASLAARGLWEWFLPRAAAVTDLELRCERLTGQLKVGLSPDQRDVWSMQALSLWSLPQQTPSSCDTAFDELHRQGLLTSERIAQRARGALSAGNVALALQLAAALPQETSAPLLLWVRLLQSPAATLQALAQDPTMPVEPVALQAGFHLLALRDSTHAAALLPALSARPDVTATLAGELQREASLGLAYDHDPAALALFASLPASLADERVQQWRVRAA